MAPLSRQAPGENATRAAYIRALQQADRGDYEPLIAFAAGR